jgi:hypothetical protein
MSSKEVLNIVSSDKRLMAMFSGAILSCVALIGLIVTAIVWYL